MPRAGFVAFRCNWLRLSVASNQTCHSGRLSLGEGLIPGEPDEVQLAFDLAFGATELLGDLAVLVTEETQESNRPFFFFQVAEQFLAVQVKIACRARGQGVQAGAIIRPSEGTLIEDTSAATLRCRFAPSLLRTLRTAMTPKRLHRSSRFRPAPKAPAQAALEEAGERAQDGILGVGDALRPAEQSLAPGRAGAGSSVPKASGPPPRPRPASRQKTE